MIETATAAKMIKTKSEHFMTSCQLKGHKKTQAGSMLGHQGSRVAGRLTAAVLAAYYKDESDNQQRVTLN